MVLRRASSSWMRWLCCCNCSLINLTDKLNRADGTVLSLRRLRRSAAVRTLQGWNRAAGLRLFPVPGWPFIGAVRTTDFGRRSFDFQRGVFQWRLPRDRAVAEA